MKFRVPKMIRQGVMTLFFLDGRTYEREVTLPEDSDELPPVQIDKDGNPVGFEPVRKKWN